MLLHALRRALHTTTVVSAGAAGSTQRAAQVAAAQAKRDRWTELKRGRHRKRLDTVSSGSRSSGGRTQHLDARMRRAQAQKQKHADALGHVRLTTHTRRQLATEEARVLQQRTRQLRARRAPGVGFTPARFRLLPMQAETARAEAFGALGLRPEVVEAAQKVLGEAARPTEVQAAGVPVLLAGKDALLAAETGGGKTLAYALPLISMLRAEESAGVERRERRPRALVLVPSRQLAIQVAGVFKQLGHVAKHRTVLAHLGVARAHLRQHALQPIDVLVATPAAAQRYLQRDAIFSPALLRHVIVDEADTLMDQRAFGRTTQDVLALVRRAALTQKKHVQSVFVAATVPKTLSDALAHKYPGLTKVATQTVHRAPERLTQVFVDVARDYQGKRLAALWYVLKGAVRDSHMLVFCNTRAHANLVFRQMARRGIPSLLLAGGGVAEKEGAEPVSSADASDLKAPVPRFDRDEVLRAFHSAEPVPRHLLPPGIELPQSAAGASEHRKIMVCTDLASRGLDTTCVRHVVLFDFPTTAADYLHRAGRTARAGARGKVTALVGKNDRRLADQIRLAVRQGATV
ncbi:hypothetical protein LPJ73_000550 [Coemansia sp. RSA 2703]|nr:hypothetical protein LPJ73_000550 [Coemansia sp. RSA 2703]KAJ2379639.1 hypothetical protein IW150_000028 [Coemansia sp. RSA 2607]KAJ2396400.1 hypothetical protein GGI05_001143 [Coemansia sp. RSA 2603]